MTLIQLINNKSNLTWMGFLVTIIIAIILSSLFRYQLHGINFSPFTGDNQDPTQGATVSEQELKEKLGKVFPFTAWVRTFTCTGTLAHVGSICHSKGKKTAIGAWLGKDLNANEAEINSLIQLIQQGNVDLAIVGSETLLRGDLTENELIAYIQRVKSETNGVPITTAEVYQVYLNHPQLMNICDVIFVNIYPYWEGVDVQYAMYFFNLKFEELKNNIGQKDIIISETGWPTDGNPIGDAVPSLENARFYFLNFLSWARSNNIPYFYFEAFDEPWKIKYEGLHAGHWGIFDKFCIIKEHFIYAFRGETIPDNWSGTEPVEGQGTPTIEFTYIPPVGSFEDVRGDVKHISPKNCRVTVYIYNWGGWWTKPYWHLPTTLIMPDGFWKCDITTGEGDEIASKIAGFLIPSNYSPPIMKGESELPQNLYENSLASVQVER